MWPLTFFKKKQEPEDVIILLDEREIREVMVDSENEEAVCSGQLTLPKADAQVRYFPSGGRAFIFGHDAEYLHRAENISRLEKSVVLRNLFDYGAAERKTHIQFYIMMGALIVTIFLLR